MLIHFHQLSEEYHTQKFDNNTLTNCINSIQEYLKQEKQEDLFIINNGGIKLITQTQWIFEKCYSIYLTFNPSTEGTLFQFSSSHVDGKKIIVNGVHCYILAGVAFYKIVYQRFTLDHQILEDLSQNHKLGDIFMNNWNEIVISHECGKLYARPKFHYIINQNSYQTHIEYPKIRSQNLEILFFPKIQCKVKEISLYNEVNNIQHKQPYYQIYPTQLKNNKFKDRIQNVVYELMGNSQITSSLIKYDFSEFGGIKILIPLFHLVQYYQPEQLDSLFEILLYTLLQDSIINKNQIIEMKLLQQISQIINIEILQLQFLVKIKQQIEDPDILNQVLLMIIDLNFIKKVQDQDQYCILLQQFYLSDHHQYLKVTPIQNLAQIIVCINDKPLIQDQLLQIMIYACQYSLQTLKENFKLFLKIAEASTINLKIKTLTQANKLIQELIKDDIDSFLIFRNYNLEFKILYDTLLLLQTDSSQVFINTLQLFGLILTGTQDILSKGMILYISKAININQQDLDILLDSLTPLLKLQYQCVEILQNLYSKTKDEKILNYYYQYIQKISQKFQQQILEQNSIWFLDQLLIEKNQKLLDIYLLLLHHNVQYLNQLLVHYYIRKNIELVLFIIDEIIIKFTDEQIFICQTILFQIFISIESYKNFEIFITKLIKYSIYIEDEHQLQQLLSEKALVYGIQKIIKLDCSIEIFKEWLYYLGKLFDQIQYLNSQEGEIFILQIIDSFNQIKNQTNSEQIISCIDYFLTQNQLIQQSLSTLEFQPYQLDAIKYQEEFNEQVNLVFQTWNNDQQIFKMSESDQLSKLTDEISNASVHMQVSVYSLFNKTRKIRNKWTKLWHTLRLTYYKPKQCLLQIDKKIDSDSQIDENQYFIYKISKEINKCYQRPILKCKFKINTQFEDDLKIPLNKNQDYKCFWLKSLFLKQGGLSITENKIKFAYYSYNEPSNHITLLSHQLKAHTPFTKSWKIDQIRYVYERIYIRNRNAIEIIFKDGESLYLIFSDLGIKEEILLKLQKQPPKLDFNKMSNFQYLMHLNYLSCRSYIDMTRYPVFPWVIKGDASDFDDDDIESIQNEINYRNLSLPIGACGSQKRLDQFIKRFENQQFYYGTHYSSQALISQYLIRLSPFTEAAISIQDGKFDIPDRLFRSIRKSWIDCNEEMADVRELIPEFYYMPEMFLNINKYQFGKLQNGTIVNNVELPFYCNKNPFYFVAQNIIAIESIMAHRLNQWIDLIWGYKQQGQEAINSYNVFYPLTYSNFDEELLEINELAMETQIAHFGQTPEQLFFKPHPHKNMQQNQGQQITQLKNKKVQSKIIYMITNKNKLICFHEDFQCSLYKWINENKNSKIIFSNKLIFEKNIQIQKCQFDAIIKFIKLPIIIFIELSIIIIGGQGNGTLIWYSFDDQKLQGVIELEPQIMNNFNTVTSMNTNKNQSILICGTNNGFIYYYNKILQDKLELKKQEILQEKYCIYDTQQQINKISISEELTIFCAGTQTGEIFIYNLYNRTLYRVIQHPKQLPIHFLTLSYSPLPCLIFSSHDERIIVYSINGFLLQILQVKENIEFIDIIKGSLNALVIITDKQSHQYRLPFLDRLTKSEAQNTSYFVQIGKSIIVEGTREGEIRIK